MILDDKEATHRNPFCLDHLVNGQPLLRVGLEAATDQLLGFVRHVRPKWFGEVELAELDSPFHSRGHGEALLGTHTTWSSKCYFDSIGKMSTSCYSQNVNDDTEGPDVTREVVLLGCQHFWS